MMPTTRTQWTIVSVATANLVCELVIAYGHFDALIAAPTCFAVAIVCDLAYLYSKVRRR